MKFGDLRSPQFRDAVKDGIAVLPLGSIEQHGSHLPVITDTALVTAIAERVEAAIPEHVYLLPTLWLGSSHHHLGFPGTVTVSSATYIQVLVETISSLNQSGFQKILLLNGHGGNAVPAADAIQRFALLAPPNPPWVVAASYWDVAADAFANQDFMESPRLTHACEFETSMMLNLRADWVDLSLADGRPGPTHTSYFDLRTRRAPRIQISQTFRQMTPSGALGQPELATAEKGGRLLDLASNAVIELVQDIQTWPPQTPR